MYLRRHHNHDYNASTANTSPHVHTLDATLFHTHGKPNLLHCSSALCIQPGRLTAISRNHSANVLAMLSFLGQRESASQLADVDNQTLAVSTPLVHPSAFPFFGGVQ